MFLLFFLKIAILKKQKTKLLSYFEVVYILYLHFHILCFVLYELIFSSLSTQSQPVGANGSLSEPGSVTFC